MATYLNLIKKLMQPDAIPSAQRATTMPDLATSFRNDPLVQRLLKAGRRVMDHVPRPARRRHREHPDNQPPKERQRIHHPPRPHANIEGYDIAFKNAGYKRFRLPTDEFVQYCSAKRPVAFLP